MRSLAEYIMRGRRQASIVAIVGFIIPMLTPLVVALVSLRRVATEGTVLLLVGMVPPWLSLLVSGSDPIAVWVTLLSLLVVFAAALYLRLSVSLPAAIVVAVALSGLMALVVSLLAQTSLSMLVGFFLEGLPDTEEAKSFVALMSTKPVQSAFLANMLACVALAALILARWFQAILYNPGGFAAEFHNLRLNALFALIAFVGFWLCRTQGVEYTLWSHLFALPLLLTSWAILSNIAAFKQWSIGWLLLSYLVVYLLLPVATLIGFLDTWLNFRSRLHKP